MLGVVSVFMQRLSPCDGLISAQCPEGPSMLKHEVGRLELFEMGFTVCTLHCGDL